MAIKLERAEKEAKNNRKRSALKKLPYLKIKLFFPINFGMWVCVFLPKDFIFKLIQNQVSIVSKRFLGKSFYV
jgi:hypothetical protein